MITILFLICVIQLLLSPHTAPRFHRGLSLIIILSTCEKTSRPDSSPPSSFVIMRAAKKDCPAISDRQLVTCSIGLSDRVVRLSVIF